MKTLRTCIAALLLWSTALPGCSWYVVKGPTANPASSVSDQCTDGYELPALDTALGVLALLLVSSGLYSLKNGDGGTAALIIGAAGAGVAGWSAYGGYRDVSRCRDAKGR